MTTLTSPGQVIHRLDEIERDLASRMNVEDRGYSTACWIWQRSITAQGYGDGWFSGEHLTAHRWAYRELHGSLPPVPLELDHLCRIRECCNPTHLEAVTRTTNARRGARSKLSLDQIEEILASSLSQSALALRYGVTKSTIGYYKSGRYAARLARQAA